MFLGGKKNNVSEVCFIEPGLVVLGKKSLVVNSCLGENHLKRF